MCGPNYLDSEDYQQRAGVLGNGSLDIGEHDSFDGTLLEHPQFGEVETYADDIGPASGEAHTRGVLLRDGEVLALA